MMKQMLALIVTIMFGMAFVCLCGALYCGTFDMSAWPQEVRQTVMTVGIIWALWVLFV